MLSLCPHFLFFGVNSGFCLTASSIFFLVTFQWIELGKMKETTLTIWNMRLDKWILMFFLNQEVGIVVFEWFMQRLWHLAWCLHPISDRTDGHDTLNQNLGSWMIIGQLWHLIWKSIPFEICYRRYYCFQAWSSMKKI